jgi:cytochrome c553
MNTSNAQIAHWLLLLVGFNAAAIPTLAADKLDPAKVEFFENKIRPVLVQHCYKCHSDKAKPLKGGLRLDSRSGILNGGESGPAIVVGNPNESLLIQALKFDGLEMPPKGKLPKKHVADFEHWVRTGATDPRTGKSVAKSKIDFTKAGKFWSFRPIKNPGVPDSAKSNGTDIDAFIHARLKLAGIKPNGPAGRRALIRRAYLNLIGIPPTPEEIHEFLKDDSPNAFAGVINRLLDSPQYGERWGRHWLDVARYGEDQAHTFKARKYPQGYRFRDWVIEALNIDMPYDQFLKAQIAGDLLPGADKHKRLAALGIFALGPVYYAENVEKAKAAADEWDDRVDTLTRGVLGLTLACARCHDHKYDPITMQDYYGLAGIFASTNYQERPIVSEEVVASRRDADEAVKQSQLSIDRFLVEQGRHLRPKLASEIPSYFVAGWKAINLAKSERNDKKVISAAAKSAKLSESLVRRWRDYLRSQGNKSDAEKKLLESWFVLLNAEDKKKDLSKNADQLEKVQTLGEQLAKAVTDRLPRHTELFNRFGVNVAFVKASDQAKVPAGVFPLGNLFDDSANVALSAAVSTDRYKAVATTKSLGVDRIATGWGTTTKIAPDVQFNFGKLGADNRAFGSIVNDAWNTDGALRTEGKSLRRNKRAEQGIGMHANALITFDLDEIRKAGLMPPDQRFVFKVDRAGINDDAFGSIASCHLAVIISKPHKDKAVSDGIIAGFVNGQSVEVDVDDFTYYFSGDLPEPVKANGKFFSLDVEIPADAKHLTLVTTGAGGPDENSISSDHAVFSGARLELNPLPKSTSETVAASKTELNEQQEAVDRGDAVVLSRMLYDEGLLALPRNEVEKYLDEATKKELQAKRKKQEALKKKAQSIQIAMAHSLTEGNSRDLEIYLQGNPAKKGELAPRAMPAILTSGTKRPFNPKGSGRLELAEAIASRDNPLTARVIVNRVWAAHFGTGLVKTTSNFGQLGDRPSHPKLLDFLASQFMEKGWSLKQLHRDIMLSHAYQRSSVYQEDTREADPENRLIWRMNRRRLEIEPWRDSMLAVSGELDKTVGGPSKRLTDANNKRRTVYGFVSRHRLDELLRLFDFPDPNITSASRTVTTVPLQQLFVLNSDFMSQRAKALAKRISQLKVGTDEQRVRYAYELMYSREVDDSELKLAMAYLAGNSEAGDRLSRWEQLSLVLLSANEFMFVD